MAIHEHSLKQVPPGTHVETVTHPSGEHDRDIELAVFKDHRLSFFFWLKWTRALRASPPLLVTIDWHRDLAPPNDKECKRLEELNQTDLTAVARFASEDLDPHNDGHVLSAAWLNLIGDVILLKNYGLDQKETYCDRAGNEHKILEFKNLQDLYLELGGREKKRIYLDIDLDYFIRNKVSPYQRAGVELYSDDEIQDLVNPNGELFKILLPSLAGITIATEPRYCGGIRNSNHILKVVMDQLFDEGLNWKHLK